MNINEAILYLMRPKHLNVMLATVTPPLLRLTDSCGPPSPRRARWLLRCRPPLNVCPTGLCRQPGAYAAVCRRAVVNWSVCSSKSLGTSGRPSAASPVAARRLVRRRRQLLTAGRRLQPPARRHYHGTAVAACRHLPARRPFVASARPPPSPVRAPAPHGSATVRRPAATRDRAPPLAPSGSPRAHWPVRTWPPLHRRTAPVGRAAAPSDGRLKCQPPAAASQPSSPPAPWQPPPPRRPTVPQPVARAASSGHAVSRSRGHTAPPVAARPLSRPSPPVACSCAAGRASGPYARCGPPAATAPLAAVATATAAAAI
ncbi:uncharacterized protein A4U43_C03F10940 [Asparagus officinalis]|uniref:Uncharacterized protein n=1 Tax=Asparagus officinalis TaxID=4686 RepID=A0A5P1FBS5_ASPOF|nr:uncharacterized protein A4U43_C03F10940 [Asparagus officinalis]